MTGRLVPPQIHGAEAGEASSARSRGARTGGTASAGPSFPAQPTAGCTNGEEASSNGCSQAQKGNVKTGKVLEQLISYCTCLNNRDIVYCIWYIFFTM